MLAQPILSSPVPPSPAVGRFVRVEYLDFQNVAEHREYRLRAYGPHGSTEFRLRIAMSVFGAGRVRLQDGPDVCYQKVLRAVAAGEMPSPVIASDDVDLVCYRDAHTPMPKRRPWTDSSLATAAIPPRHPPTSPSGRFPVSSSVTNHATPLVFEEGQRVSHAVFGIGVTMSSSAGHTVVCFDQHGPRTFVTSMLKLDVLSAPHTWETGPRGMNRPCRAPARR